MGRSEVSVGKHDIIVAGIRYPKTDGLWRLIMSKIPSNFTDEDFILYRQLVEQTGVMSHPNVVNNTSRPKLTYKWRQIFSKFRNGKGIQFLPGDLRVCKTNYVICLLNTEQATSMPHEIKLLL